MRLRGVIEVHVASERLTREPTFWDRIVRRLGGEPDLRTDRVRAAIEAVALVDGMQRALRGLGIRDAISLIVDDQVLFHDREGHRDDLGDLFLAFHDAAPVFGKEFGTLRLAAEHVEAGLHYVVELVAQSEHALDEPTARVFVSGRIQAFEPRPGEDADAYRARAEPLTRDGALLELHRHQFDSLVHRVESALAGALPETRVRAVSADATVARPSRGRRRATSPTRRDYDPHDAWHPNPMEPILSAMMWTSILSMAMPPHVMMVDHDGQAIGSPQEVAAHDGGGPTPHAGDGDLGGGDLGGGDLGGGDLGGGDFGFD